MDYKCRKLPCIQSFFEINIDRDPMNVFSASHTVFVSIDTKESELFIAVLFLSLLRQSAV